MIGGNRLGIHFKEYKYLKDNRTTIYTNYLQCKYNMVLYNVTSSHNDSQAITSDEETLLLDFRELLKLALQNFSKFE